MPHLNRLSFIIILLPAVLFCVFILTAEAAEINFYVSPDGNDLGPGNSLDKPFATIQEARNAVRELRKNGEITGPVTVYIREGRYELSESLIFLPGV